MDWYFYILICLAAMFVFHISLKIAPYILELLILLIKSLFYACVGVYAFICLIIGRLYFRPTKDKVKAQSNGLIEYLEPFPNLKQLEYVRFSMFNYEVKRRENLILYKFTETNRQQIKSFILSSIFLPDKTYGIVVDSSDKNLTDLVKNYQLDNYLSCINDNNFK